MPKYNTLALDSAGEVARLLFSWEMKKKSSDMESIRQPQNFPGMTERLNIIARSLRNLRDNGTNVVILGHEDIQGIYAPGKSMIATKGAPQADPIAIKGWIDVPGKTAPQELERVIDNLLHVRLLNGKPIWVARNENLTADSYWDVKDRFGAKEIAQGLLPPSYSEVKKLAEKLDNWAPAFIWALYGPVGIGKTRCLETFPHPIKIIDVDRGTGSIRDQLKKHGGSIKLFQCDAKGQGGNWKEVETFPTPPGSLGPIDVVQFDSEDCSSYQPFLQEISGCLT